MVFPFAFYHQVSKEEKRIFVCFALAYISFVRVNTVFLAAIEQQVK